MTAFGEYGKALFLAAQEEESIDRIYDDLKVASAVLAENPCAVKLFDTPAISRSEKHAMAQKVFGSLDVLVVNLIKLMSDRSLFYGFMAAAEDYFTLRDEYYGIERAEAVTARPMSEEQLRALTVKLERVTGKHVILTNTVDPSILGGAIVRYSGVQLDGSLKARLDTIERELKNSVI